MIADRNIKTEVINEAWGISNLSELHEKNKMKFEGWLKTFPIAIPCNESQLEIIKKKIEARGDQSDEVLQKILKTYNVGTLKELSFENAGKVIMRLK